ncbi:hypothetical protein ABB37_09825 [Leptomonas pyrrhocoris]|uniref:Uncharacterized protein n=1 Tax=Leptomonas pyrrhocoris TaxID=157538 RepID=A0A0M9FPM8_LEPPY|nr:hypothetical protein ABB37_09825 [Leptomonas pyrrhocoris]XP_015651949.1 hypothetical protein ABB37_09825 [Leptomonas pyrrhocoris]KPA73509.1 hypothetical protein ABB37_09825 [Leptomonas pyrrhocoris]KPA73510.1 hypothetical protein ABB37_09825 [Leptomonas pyrrhocoris]|eukprot:XP_015651948.1 hypothetical protein ABB37_09825 [Leptomonas pyrrhocoris]
MRHSFQRLCARNLFVAAATSVPAVVGTREDQATRMHQKCLDPQVPPSDLVRFSSALLPFIADGSIELRQQMQLLNALATRSVRHEGVIQKCLWDVFKAPLPCSSTTAFAPENESLSLMELSAYTSRAFRLMAEQQFLNDPQMTAIALGRCVELATHLTMRGVCDAYKGLRAVSHMFFSTADAAHHDSELAENMTMKEFYQNEDAPDARTLRNQPNLIDVLCGELEMQLHRCACVLGTSSDLAGGDHTQLVLSSDAAQTSISPPSSPSSVALGEPRCFLDVLDSLAVVGVQHASTLDCLASLVPRYRSSTSSGFFIHALHHAAQIDERVADPLAYEETASVQDARRHLTQRLSEEIQQMPGAAGYLRHNPSELLLLRRLFEREAVSAALSPELWDTVRTIRVAHRHTVAESQRSSRPTGKLFDKKYAIKVKPISVDNSETERFVPPEFKTWRSPAATPRREHPRNGRAPRRMAFGTRRISKNYIKDKRKKFCPAVF